MIIGIASTRPHMMGRDPSGSSLGDEPNGFNGHRRHLPQSYADLLNWNPDGPIDWDAAHTANEAPPYHGPNGASRSPPPPYTRSPPPSYTRSPGPSHVEIYPNSLETGAPENSPPPRGHLADEDHARQAASHAPSPSSSPDTNNLPNGT